MTLTTEALVVPSVGKDAELTSILLSAIQPTEALIEIRATGICHTDIACMEGKLPAGFPSVLGHEGGFCFQLSTCMLLITNRIIGAGVVRQIGDKVRNVHVGDKVLLSYNFCGDCIPCKSNTPAYCDKMIQLNFGGRRLDGSPTVFLPEGSEVFSSFFGQSSFSRLAIVNQSSLVAVPQETPLEIFAPLGCGLQTGAGAIINALQVHPGSSVAISGVGSVGLSAIMAAKFRQAKIIIAVDIQAQRLELAKEMGATHTILGGKEDIADHIREICQPRNGVELALDCSGVPQVIENLVDSLATRGRAVGVGAPAPGKRAGVDVFAHLTLGREFRGCHQGDSVAQEVGALQFFPN